MAAERLNTYEDIQFPSGNDPEERERVSEWIGALFYGGCFGDFGATIRR